MAVRPSSVALACMAWRAVSLLRTRILWMLAKYWSSLGVSVKLSGVNGEFSPNLNRSRRARAS